MNHQTIRPKGATGELHHPHVNIIPIRGKRETIPTHWVLSWREKAKGGKPALLCSRTGDSRADLRAFAKKKLKATHFFDGPTGDRAIKL